MVIIGLLINVSSGSALLEGDIEMGDAVSAEAEGGEAVDVNVDMAAPATPEAPPA